MADSTLHVSKNSGLDQLRLVQVVNILLFEKKDVRLFLMIFEATSNERSMSHRVSLVVWEDSLKL